jgi:hypothetical protein
MSRLRDSTVLQGSHDRGRRVRKTGHGFHEWSER